MESSAVIGSVVPITSWLMARPELCNGAPNSICCFWVNLLSLYWLEALFYLYFFPMNRIHLMINYDYGRIHIDALLHCLCMRLFIDHTYWNHISLIFSFSLSLPLPFIHILFFILYHNPRSDWFFFYVYVILKRFQLLQRYDQYII